MKKPQIKKRAHLSSALDGFQRQEENMGGFA
jgi:hypothetical protein